MNLEMVEKVVALVSESSVSEISLEHDGWRVLVRKPFIAQVNAPELAETILEVETETEISEAAEPVIVTQIIPADLVGLFRHSEPPIGYGASIREGQIVGSIEAMKVMNDVRATVAGKVADIYVEEGSPVEYGQALFRLLSNDTD